MKKKKLVKLLAQQREIIDSLRVTNDTLSVKIGERTDKVRVMIKNASGAIYLDETVKAGTHTAREFNPTSDMRYPWQLEIQAY